MWFNPAPQRNCTRLVPTATLSIAAGGVWPRCAAEAAGRWRSLLPQVSPIAPRKGHPSGSGARVVQQPPRAIRAHFDEPRSGGHRLLLVAPLDRPLEPAVETCRLRAAGGGVTRLARRVAARTSRRRTGATCWPRPLPMPGAWRLIGRRALERSWGVLAWWVGPSAGPATKWGCRRRASSRPFRLQAANALRLIPTDGIQWRSHRPIRGRAAHH